MLNSTFFQDYSIKINDRKSVKSQNLIEYFYALNYEIITSSVLITKRKRWLIAKQNNIEYN